MAKFLSNGFIIVAEIPVTWQGTAPENPPPGFNPVFLSDASGVRAAIVVPCVRCGVACGIGPVVEGEQAGWNLDPPKVNLMFECNSCNAFYLITWTRAWMLRGLPIRPTSKPSVDVFVPPLTT